VHTNEAGRRVALLRAYDKATGADVGAVEMPNKQTGSPMSYQIDGTQFIVLAVSGSDEGVAGVRTSVAEPGPRLRAARCAVVLTSVFL
jgi:hypothetical protein